jgi:hypothetical protein
MFSSSVGSFRIDERTSTKFTEYAINCVYKDDMMKCEWMVWKRFSAFKELLFEVNADLTNGSFSLNSWNDKLAFNKNSESFITKRM